MITVIIPCAGKGERFGGAIPKQFQNLKGIPLFLHTLKPFISHKKCDNIIIAVPKKYISYVEELLKGLEIKKPWMVVEGGSTRQESVSLALSSAPKETEIFLIHDAVRPLVKLDLINRVLDAIKEEVAAIPAIPVRDALIRGEREYLMESIPRENLYLVQTPQAIKASPLKEALEKAFREGLLFPDEGSLMQYYGYRVKIVLGSPLNIKITYPEDLILAERFISE